MPGGQVSIDTGETERGFDVERIRIVGIKGEIGGKRGENHCIGNTSPGAETVFGEQKFRVKPV